MKLDIDENLINLEMYYRNVLGYNCSWVKLTDEILDMHYEIQLDREFLIIEVASIEHMLKYCDDSTSITQSELDNIISGVIAIPEIAYKMFGTHPDAMHKPPCFIVSYMPHNTELYTNTGAKVIYNFCTSGIAGTKTYPILNYFLFCYDRNCKEFLSIPKTIITDIENYLKSQNRPIFDIA